MIYDYERYRTFASEADKAFRKLRIIVRKMANVRQPAT